MSSSTGRINYPIYEMENNHKQSSPIPNHQFLDAYSPKYGDSGFDYPSSHDAPCRIRILNFGPVAESSSPRKNFPAPPSNATQRGKSFTVSWHFSRIRSGSRYDSYDTQLVGGSLTPLKNKSQFCLLFPRYGKKAMFQTFPNHQPAVFDHSRTGKFLPEPSQWSSQSNSTNSTCSKSVDSDDSKSKSENHWKTKETRPLWGITMMEPFLLHQTEDINRKRHHIKIPLKKLHVSVSMALFRLD